MPPTLPLVQLFYTCQGRKTLKARGDPSINYSRACSSLMFLPMSFKGTWFRNIVAYHMCCCWESRSGVCWMTRHSFCTKTYKRPFSQTCIHMHNTCVHITHLCVFSQLHCSPISTPIHSLKICRPLTNPNHPQLTKLSPENLQLNRFEAKIERKHFSLSLHITDKFPLP